MRLKHPVLFGIRQSRIERQHFGVRQVALVQRIGGIADFALTAHEDQDIAATLASQLIHRIKYRLQLIAIAIIRFFNHRPVAHFDRVSPAGNFDDRRIIKVTREALRIDGRRGNNHFQIGAARQQLTQITEQEINIQAALVRLINDDGVILHQQAILLDFRQQDPVGHQFNLRQVADLVVKPHFIADTAAQ